MSPKLRRYLKIRDELLPVPISEAPPPYFILNDNGERVTENTLRRRLYSWVRKSGLKKAGIKPHDLRRTFGTWFLQANPGHVREIAELMGTRTSRSWTIPSPMTSATSGTADTASRP